MNKRRFFAVILLLLVLAVVVVTGRGLLLRWQGGEGRAVIEALQPGVDVELTGIRFSETRQGVRKYLLAADSATYSAHGISLMYNIEVTFFDTDGRETMWLRADEGDLSGNNQAVKLRGDVVLKGAQGFVLKTDYLTYNKDDDRLQTDATVLLESAQGVLRGRGLIVAPAQERLQLLHDVSGEFGAGLVKFKPGHGQG
ncbi:MAG: LPS export ABC transporter periplasmic protein LptC [Deltaproteobacteria bacterium HGW-Deltaproteobacteria-4]|nr:MAG: LPS export ABC transporter periplasmic protein LptC [Deltaproteobacteria bacterium HGW-Deltaproteobacteria-4]